METASKDELRRARALLSRAVEPPSPQLVALIAEVGPVRAAQMVGEGASLPRGLSVREATPQQVNPDLATIAEFGGRLVIPEDDEWPFRQWHVVAPDGRWAPPVALWVRGARLDTLCARAVAITGARAATGYGEHASADIAYDLARQGYTVVAGGAWGIDAAAHRGALAAEGGRTVAVLACGLDQSYPAGHHRLLQQILDQGGALVSEYQPGSRPSRERFLARNRLIAAADGTVVVEAGVRSGSRRTAAAAKAMGKPLMAVPGPVTSAVSVNCHALIRSGHAVLVTNAAEVVETLRGHY